MPLPYAYRVDVTDFSYIHFFPKCIDKGIVCEYQNKLQSFMDEAQGILDRDANVTKVENTYLRHKVMTEAEDETEPIYRLEEFLFLQPHSFNMTVFSDRRSIIVLHQSLPHSMISSSVTL